MLVIIKTKYGIKIEKRTDCHALFLPAYTLFQFCPGAHSFNEDDIKK